MMRKFRIISSVIAILGLSISIGMQGASPEFIGCLLCAFWGFNLRDAMR